jgi:two-component system, NarL family, nitrate/nitrite response regulator NarL
MARSTPKPDSKPIRVLVADDHPVVREGLRACLADCRWIKFVGEASDGFEVLAKCQTLRPDLVLMDISLPRLSGLEAAEQLHRAHPQISILALTAHKTSEHVLSMVTAGARGYVMKDSAPEVLLKAIQTVHAGGTYFSPGIVAELVQDLAHRGDGAPQAKADGLSRRERQVLALIADGLSNKEMGSALGVSVRTVETHRERLMNKLQIRTVAGLTRYALAQGLVKENGNGLDGARRR